MAASKLVYLLILVGKIFIVHGEGNTTTPESSGLDVTTDVIKQIQDSDIFDDDYGFLSWLARVESNYGTDSETYRDGYDGGIWQVDEAYFIQTQDTSTYPELTAKITAIQDKFGIDWLSLTWEDMRTPLYSGIAASLFLSTIPEAIPATTTEQKTYYATYYRPGSTPPPDPPIPAPPPDILIPDTSGIVVVNHVIQVIHSLRIFVWDYRFMYRLAVIESLFGTRYIVGFYGGIWGVPYWMFLRTQNYFLYPRLLVIYARIWLYLGIDWRFVTWWHLQRPLYSGLAARLFLFTLHVRIPRRMRAQARFWALHYHPGGSISDFISLVMLYGDPHLKQVVGGSDKPLCYDVFGNDGDVYNFLADPALDLKIAASLISEDKKPGEYVGKVAAFMGPISVYINVDVAIIQGKSFNWSENIDADVYEGVHLTIAKDRMVVNLFDFVWMKLRRVHKTLTFLDFNVNHLGKLSDQAEGILGDVARNAKILVNKKHANEAELVLTNADNTTSKFPLLERDRCWKLIGRHTNEAKEFKRLLSRNRLKCLDC